MLKYVLTTSETVAYQSAAAAAKVAATRSPVRYAISAMLAGSYIGVAVVLMVSASGPLMESSSGWVKLINGLVFGIALTLVVFAGGELATSNMMTLPQGAFARSITWIQAGVTLIFAFVGNLVGSLLFGTLVHFTGLIDSETPAGRMLVDMLAHKAVETPVELFFRGILCNFLVCIAMWSVARMTSDGPKFVIIFWCLLAFITSGFEHVIANMTTFTIGLWIDATTWSEFGRNLLFVGLGNLVGGAILVGLAYSVIGGGARTQVTEHTSKTEAE